MDTYNEKFPDPKELEKELSDFLAKKFAPFLTLLTMEHRVIMKRS